MIEIKGYDHKDKLHQFDFGGNHGFTALTDPSSRVCYFPVTKNASTMLQHELKKNGWTDKFVRLDSQISCFTVLRDPWQRYMTGFVEDFFRYIQKNDDKATKDFLSKLASTKDFHFFLNFLFDNKFYHFDDEHTDLQIKQLGPSLERIGKNRFTFIKLTSKLTENVNNYLKAENCEVEIENTILHSNQNTHLYRSLLIYFMDGKNLSRKERLLNYLQLDYDFINSINFFNGA